MRNIPNDIVQSLIRHLPIIIGCIDMKNINTRTYNAIRLTKINLKRLESIEKTEIIKRQSEHGTD